MSETQKKILYISIFVIFAIAAGFVIYFVFFRPSTPGPDTNTTNGNVNAGGLPSTNVDVNRPLDNTNTGIPVTNDSGVSGANINGSTGIEEVTPVNTVVTDAVGDAQLNTESGKLVYYDAETDLFYESGQDGSDPRQLSTQEFPDAKSITFANTGRKAVVEFPDSTKIIYDFDAQKQYPLPKEAADFSFSPDGGQIAYKYLPSNVEDRWIVAANIDTSGLKFIEQIGDEANNVDVNWSPKGDVVATFRKSASSGSQEIFFIGQDHENFKSAETEGRGFTGAWSPSGEQMLYSVYSDSTNYNPQLYIMNASGDAIGSGRTDLGLSTWPDKCTFSGAYVYCAEPRFLEPGSGLYPDSATNIQDQFYRVNLVTGSTELIANPYGVSAYDLWLSGDGSTLYFRNAQTGRIESVPVGG